MLSLRSFRKILTLKCDYTELNTYFRGISTAGYPLQIKISPALWAQPLKAKKRVDPAIIKQKEMKRQKKLEKEIRRLEKFTKNLKPLIEYQHPLCLLKESQLRKRTINVTPELDKERLSIFKKWGKVKYREFINDTKMLNRLVQSQQEAIEELKRESLDLYKAALEVDPDLIPFDCQGPTDSPPLKNYFSPDGDYVNVTPDWK